MLRALEIRDMLIIDRLELNFQPGLNVLTGETGAGKSILLDSLGFALGWRGRAELVRSGADQGEVTAEFDLPEGHAAHDILEEAGLPGGETLILRRVNTRDGRKTAWVNDRRCSGEALRRLSETLIELHGQHDDRGLLDAKGHRALLDSFADHEKLQDAVRTKWRALLRGRSELSKAKAALAEVKAEEDFLIHAVEEFNALDPQPGEEAELDTRRRQMQGAEKIREDVARALKALGSDGAEGAMGDATRWLEDAAEKADGLLTQPIDALGRAFAELSDAIGGVETALNGLSFNPYELEETEERLFAIRALARKHNIPAEQLGEFATDLRNRLSLLDQSEGHLAELSATVSAAQADFDAAAAKLIASRYKAAGALDKAVTAELAPLKMDRAVFRTEIQTVEGSGEGIDEVGFSVATNPGAPSGPLGKIASGGELSRFLLALKVCLSQKQSGVTMIFDEIDRGVGGATADAVGRRLSTLASGSQVLVVTHSPQVAALGAHHWRVEKHVKNDVTTSTVVPLSAADRVDEIARMVSGDTVTSQARAAARALIDASA